jgi:hypothetical protein
LHDTHIHDIDVGLLPCLHQSRCSTTNRNRNSCSLFNGFYAKIYHWNWRWPQYYLQISFFDLILIGKTKF